MDPFIELQQWQDFHVSMIVEIKRQIGRQLPEGYAITAELSVTKQSVISGKSGAYRSDIGVTTKSDVAVSGNSPSVLTPPTALALGEKIKQRTLTIRTADGGDLVTALEVLSPTNKHGTGLDIYRSKRRGYLQASVNVVEIDLLRGGIRPHMNPGWSATPYAVQVVEGATEDIQYWGIGITDTLPVIPIPLLDTDFLALSLQEAFTSVYSYSSYRRKEYDLDAVVPELSDRERQALESVLSAA